MKKMVTLLLLPVALAFGGNEDLSADLQKPIPVASHSLTYFKTGPGFMGIIPKIGVGQRIGYGRYGLDVSYATSAFFIENDWLGAKGFVAGFESDFLFYFSPDSPSRGYIGMGAKPGLTEVGDLLVTPEMLFGYEFAQKGKMKGFVQLEVRPLSIRQELMLSPVTVGLGFGF